jgi:hypothetical protein
MHRQLQQLLYAKQLWLNDRIFSYGKESNVPNLIERSLLQQDPSMSSLPMLLISACWVPGCG